MHCTVITIVFFWRFRCIRDWVIKKVFNSENELKGIDYRVYIYNRTKVLVTSSPGPFPAFQCCNDEANGNNMYNVSITLGILAMMSGYLDVLFSEFLL